MLVAAVFCVIIGSIFWVYLSPNVATTKTLLHELSNPSVARGLITFLIAISTVGIALILVIYVVSTYDALVKDHFALGKEVLTSLIGILGTIVGFYFGQTSGQSNSETVNPVSNSVVISDVAVKPPHPKGGGTVTLTASISGGEEPYLYTVKLSPEVIPPIAGATNGPLKEDLHLPASFNPVTALNIEIVATDAKKNTAPEPAHYQIGPGAAP
ncbi:hypothetical protein [Caballeronia arationis]|uniref:hypothetical protein n=1 Tax=Caballeronia arationis TaxID=1777142 RepID=UPI0011981EC1|nr:hypothetical protein [Caballeronia arationis]